MAETTLSESMGLDTPNKETVVVKLPEELDSIIELEPENKWDHRGYQIIVKNCAGEKIGNVSGLVRKNHFTITDAEMAPPYRGKSIARKAYEELINDAFDHGFSVSSDSKVTDDAVRVYESLRKHGFNVVKNPLAQRGEYERWVTQDESPVFTVSKHTEE